MSDVPRSPQQSFSIIVEFQPFKRSYSQLTFFNFFNKKLKSVSCEYDFLKKKLKNVSWTWFAKNIEVCTRPTFWLVSMFPNVRKKDGASRLGDRGDSRSNRFLRFRWAQAPTPDQFSFSFSTPLLHPSPVYLIETWRLCSLRWWPSLWAPQLSTVRFVHGVLRVESAKKCVALSLVEGADIWIAQGPAQR